MHLRALRRLYSAATFGKTPKLVEVGHLDVPKVQGKYQSGQFFLHRIFGYRGVILFPWVARLFDRDAIFAKRDDDNNADSGSFRSEIYYQALIDVRDFPHIRVNPEAVTFLASQRESTLYSLPGLDYVGHEDVVPYCPSEKESLHHDLFDKFLEPNPNKSADVPFVARESLLSWQSKNHQWLQLTDVHRQITSGIRVTVTAFYMGCRQSQQGHSTYWWRYSIRIENMIGEQVQLRERHWSIYSLTGTMETVRGRGVVGQEPILTAKSPAFQYSSHVSLQASSGHMWGTFRMERQDGSTFDCRIPPFALEIREASSG
ncbi:polymerase delta-interacting protein 2-like isoform X2 [Oscarella lobularis]|uniref:polymerase delta-interacting protein 2-like isoform X2 n=1 Tax=Oscarella lobularis TaxID=121494 RepID=UPI003313A5FF